MQLLRLMLVMLVRGRLRRRCGADHTIDHSYGLRIARALSCCLGASEFPVPPLLALFLTRVGGVRKHRGP